MTNDTPTGPIAEDIAILARANRASIAYCRREGSADIPGVVYLGGFRSDMTGDKANAVDLFCTTRHQSVIRFDYTGHGKSGGAFEDGTIGSWLADSLDVIDQLTTGPLILIGSSMGGWLALLAALARPERITCLILIAPAADFTEDLAWNKMTEAQRQRLVEDGQICVPSSYDPDGYILTHALIEDGRRHRLLDTSISFAGAVRILHGMEDQDIPWQHSLRLLEALTTPNVTLTLVKDSGHRLSRGEDVDRILAALDDLSQCV